MNQAIFARRKKYPTTVGWYRVKTNFGEAICLWNGKWFGGLLKSEIVVGWCVVNRSELRASCDA